jgi:hypothetical protein
MKKALINTKNYIDQILSRRIHSSHHLSESKDASTQTRLILKPAPAIMVKPPVSSTDLALLKIQSE